MRRLICLAIILNTMLIGISCSPNAIKSTTAQTASKVPTPTTTTQQTPIPRQIAGFQVAEYTHEVYACKVLYPSTWTRSTEATNFISITFQSPDSFSRIQLAIYPSVSSFSLEEYIEINAEASKYYWDEYREISRTSITSPEYDNGIIITTSYLFKGMSIKEKSLWLKKGGVIYSVNGISSESEFDAYSQLFDGVLNSFSFKQ